MNPQTESCPQREFAVQVVKQLREAGFEAVWAGGCVRDQLLGLMPKDYDIATDATPDNVRQVFGNRKTLALGESFGVITVLGGRDAGQIEVATFRRDAEYSDGRRPDAVHYSSAEEDAHRRDFTINGMFYDPIEKTVLDYVGGQDDLKRGVIQAIGRAEDRIKEDKLRMLRAVRFAARLNFTLESQTLAAIQECAAEIHVVSGERIAAEMRRILAAPRPLQGLKLLATSGLMTHVAPMLEAEQSGAVAPEVERVVQRLVESQPAVDFVRCLGAAFTAVRAERRTIDQTCDTWRLSNDERKELIRISAVAPELLAAHVTPWPAVQRLLSVDVDKHCHALQVAEAAASNANELTAVAGLQERIAAPREQWDPPALIDGQDLKNLGITPGPQFKLVLEAVRNKQLEGDVATHQEALDYARRVSV